MDELPYVKKLEFMEDTNNDMKSFMSVEMWPEAAICAQELIDRINQNWPHPFPYDRVGCILRLDMIIDRAQKLESIGENT